jgi:hypothetical protein
MQWAKLLVMSLEPVLSTGCFTKNNYILQLGNLGDPIYTIYTHTRVCGHPFKRVDLAISVTPVAYSWTKLSTQPCNLHRQTLVIHALINQWLQCGTVIGCHLSKKSVCQISVLLEYPRSTVSAVIVKWKRLGATTAQPHSGPPCTEAHST